MQNPFKVNYKDTRTASIILIGVFIVNFEQISHVVRRASICHLEGFFPTELFSLFSTNVVNL